MSLQPYIALKIADERHRDLIAQAEAHRRVRAATDRQPTTRGRSVLGGACRAARIATAVIRWSTGARRPLPDEA
jgi:hypothetical protein